MSLIAKLQFGDNSCQRYAQEYLLVDFRCHIARSHNEWRPDGNPRCDSLELTVIVPGREDLNMYEWYAGRSPMSGRILIELSTPAQNQDVVYKEVLFENGVCYAISEEYHIDKDRRRTLHMSIAVQELTVDKLCF